MLVQLYLAKKKHYRFHPIPFMRCKALTFPQADFATEQGQGIDRSQNSVLLLKKILTVQVIFYMNIKLTSRYKNHRL